MAEANQHLELALTQLLEAGDGKTIVRFLVSAENLPTKRLSFKVKTASDATIATDPIAITSWQKMEGHYSRLYSASLPSDLHDFTIAVDGGNGRHVLLHVDRKHYRETVQARDAIMVNPGIDSTYNGWFRAHEATEQQLREQQSIQLPHQPLFSIVVPLYNTPKRFLKDMIRSVHEQSYQNWELLLVNASSKNTEMTSVVSRAVSQDHRIKSIELEDNLGIAGNTNVGITAAVGDYVCFCDHDDMLAPNALYEYARAINESRDVGVLYCDEDSFGTDLSYVYHPRFKPDFNKDLLYSHCYILHMLAIKRSVLETLEPSPDEVSGAQDYDLMLKAYEKGAPFLHIPKVLYHWRQHEGSTNGGITASKPYVEMAGAKVVENHLARMGIAAHVELTDISCVYRAVYNAGEAEDTNCSIVYVPENEGAFSLSVLNLLQVSSDDVIVALSRDARIKLKNEKNVNVVFSDRSGITALFNEGARIACHDTLVLVGGDVASIDSDAIQTAASYLARQDIGLIGFKGFSLDGLIVHSGVCVRSDGILAFMNQDFSASMGGGYMGTAECTCDFSAVASSCVVTRKSLFNQLGGLQFELPYPMALVDYSFKIREAGLCVLQTPYAHYRVNDFSISDKDVVLSDSKEYEASSGTDAKAALNDFYNRWKSLLSERDPLVNENLSQEAHYFSMGDRDYASSRAGRAYAIAKYKMMHLFG